jgi:hypothetical protein
MTPLKNNLGPDTTGFAFAVRSVTLDDSDVDTSMVVWADYNLNKTTAQAPIEKAEDNGSAIDKAKDFLLAFLKAGPVPSRKVLDTAMKAALPRRPYGEQRGRCTASRSSMKASGAGRSPIVGEQQIVKQVVRVKSSSDDVGPNNTESLN